MAKRSPLRQFGVLAKVISATGASNSSLTNPVEEIAKHPAVASKDKNLVHDTLQALKTKQVANDDDARVAVVKVAIALLPVTSQSLLALLHKRSQWHYEMHFTIFCFLDASARLAKARTFASRVPSIVERYLKSLRRDPADSAFMAAEMLGEHWDVKEAFRILSRVAKSPASAIGRKAAVGGLASIAARPEASKTVRQKANEIIEEVSRRDPNARVRAYARFFADRQR